VFELERRGVRQGLAPVIETLFHRGPENGGWDWETLRADYELHRSRATPLPKEVALARALHVNKRQVSVMLSKHMNGIDTMGNELSDNRKEFYDRIAAVIESVDGSEKMLEHWDGLGHKMANQNAFRYAALTHPDFIEPMKSERERTVVMKGIEQGLIRAQQMLSGVADATALDTAVAVTRAVNAGNTPEAREILVAFVAETFQAALVDRS